MAYWTRWALLWRSSFRMRLNLWASTVLTLEFQAGSNLFDRFAFGQELQDFLFSHRQGGKTGLAIGGLDARAEFIHELREHARAQVAGAAANVPIATALGADCWNRNG